VEIAAERGEIVWTPSPERIASSVLHRFAASVLAGVADHPTIAQAIEEYDALWRWSVADLGRFWTSLVDWFDVPRSGSAAPALPVSAMPGARWFPDLRLNYAEACLRGDPDRVCLVAANEAGRREAFTKREMSQRVGRVAAALLGLGVEPGDRVAAYLPNMPEAVIVVLAAASIGAVWSCCPPEFGPDAVIDRFAQIAPKVLVAADGYTHRGRVFDRRPVVEQVRSALPSLVATVWVDNLGTACPPWAVALGALEADPVVRPVRVPFEHPLWILYSSGTTGAPKPIVHGHGGIVVEQVKAHALHADIGPSARFFQHTSIGWTMWNILVSALALDACIVTYDGAPDHGGPDALWALTEELAVTDLGVGAAFLAHCMATGQRPARQHGLSRLRSVGSTGAALPPEGFRWVYEEVGRDLHLRCNSGGTEVCGGLLGSAPILPVRAGELQCPPLGVDVAAFDEEGRRVVGRPGELVVVQPMPSMPLRLWGDTDGQRYRESYFSTYPGVWRHGDWVTVHPDGYSVVHGRSDATLNRDGVRIGTSEIYRVIEQIEGVGDCLVVDLTGPPADLGLLLLLVPAPGAPDLDALAATVRAELRAKASPRHVPDRIEWVGGLARTLNGKRLEVPVKRMLRGTPLNDAVNVEAVDDPALLVDLVARVRPSPPAPD
jgi:acetoacetyl-CoA synthetase